MKTCMFTGMFRNDTFETCIKNAASIGFDAVEIRFAPPHFNVQDNNKTLKEKSDIIQNYGLEVAEIYTFIGGFSTKTNQECEQEVESFRYQAEAAKLLGANMIKISPGGPNAFLAKPEHFERSARWISKLANIAKATPQNTQKERPCGKIPPGRAYIRHSISAAATLI